jgi:hypothetical protein
VRGAIGGKTKLCVKARELAETNTLHEPPIADRLHGEGHRGSGRGEEALDETQRGARGDDDDALQAPPPPTT